MTDTQIFEPDGRAIPYGVEGAGPAIVLIAGQGLNIGSLDTLAHSVAQEDFRVVRAGSRRPSGAATMGDLAQDVIDVMNHLGIDNAWVGGHGFGGAVARVVALEHHDRVNGSLLLGVSTFAGMVPADVPAPFLDAEVVKMQDAAWEEPAALAEGLPVLVIQGTDDEITPAANGEELRASAPQLVSVVPIEGAGHLFPVTHMGATSWAIEDYLDWD